MEQIIQQYLEQQQTPDLDRCSIQQHLEHLPGHIEPLDSQVAGHINGMFRDVNDKHLLKPILDQRGKRELRFYRLLFEHEFDPKDPETPLIHKLRSFVPMFCGTQRFNQVEFICLQDITQHMNHPHLMDIKIGQKTHDRFADERKIQHELNKNSINRVLGYRVLGVKIFDWEMNKYQGKSREYFKSLNVEQANQTIDWYMSQIPAQKSLVLSKFIQKLEHLVHWFENENQNGFEFISSSLLFAYSQNDQNQIQVDLRMIDFAHVYPLAGSTCWDGDKNNTDQNYLFGLRNLLKLIANFN